MKQLGKYEIVEFIGRGAYAEVYRAVDTILQRTVALKLLKPSLMSDEEAVARFLREAQTAANLIHPQIAWVWETGELEGRYYLAMRYIDGVSLDRLLKSTGAMDWAEALKAILQIGEALTFAHGRGLVHRDVKPANILIGPLEGAVLTDFGLVRAMESGNFGTHTGALIGTPAYIAPEIWRNKPIGPAADQYSLACVWVEMLTGRPLFNGATPPAMMHQHLLEGPQLPETWPDGCPAGFTTVIRRALALDPAERFPDVAAFMAALQGVPTTTPAGQTGPELSSTLPAAVLPAADTPAPEADRLPAVLPAVLAAASGPADHLIGNQPPGANLPPAVDSTEKPALNPTVDQTGAPAVGPAEDRSAKAPVGPPPGATPGRPAGARGKRSGWWIALASLGGLALLAVCGLGAAWLLDWLPWPAPGPTSIPTQAAVAVITQSSLPPATATLKPTLAAPTASPTPRPTARPTNTTPPTVDPRIPPPCSAIGQTWTSPADGMTLVCVPAGEFLMGSLGDDANADADEKPQHPVTLDAYWIDQTEVTNAMFAAFVAATGYQTQAEVEGWGTITVTKDGWGNIAGVTWQRPTGYGSGIIGLEDHPVVQVSWDDAQAYCEWAGRQLPSEAQWEKAARGTDARVYPWGNQLPDTTFLNFYANMGGTTTVGRYPKGASPYGALDLAGNVWEWTADWYDQPYYASPAAGTNPTGPESGKYRLIRGGSWKNATWYVRTASRIGFSPNTRVEILGFRCALNPAP